MSAQNAARLTPQPRADTGDARVNGVFDLPAPNRVAGWAIDRADEAAAVEVEIRQDGVLLARTTADRHRPDLEKGGVGTGRYGFSVTLVEPVPPELIFTLSVRAVTRDGSTGALRPTGEATPQDDPLLRLVERSYEQTRALKAEVRRLAQVVEAGGPETGEVSAVLERIELVQARLDGTTAETPAIRDPAVSPGLRWAVGAALGLSVLALGIGLWSLFA